MWMNSKGLSPRGAFGAILLYKKVFGLDMRYEMTSAGDKLKSPSTAARRRKICLGKRGKRYPCHDIIRLELANIKKKLKYLY